MPTLPPAILLLVAPFAPLFTPRVWRHAQVLLGGAIPTPGRRAVAAALLGLVSLVTLFAQQRRAGPAATIRQAAWYPKTRPTFVDALALLRRDMWAHRAFSLWGSGLDLIKVPRQFLDHVTETLCYAA